MEKQRNRGPGVESSSKSKERVIPGQQTGASPGFENQSREQLLEEAKRAGITGYETMSKEELINALHEK
jgi:hypothetical protein